MEEVKYDINQLVTMIENDFDDKETQENMKQRVMKEYLLLFADERGYHYSEFAHGLMYREPLQFSDCITVEFKDDCLDIVCPHQGGSVKYDAFETEFDLWLHLLYILATWY